MSQGSLGLVATEVVAGHADFETRPLSFALAPSQVVALVGVSGSGKTSALRTLAGLASPTSGVVDWCGRGRPVLCFQEARLLPWRSAQQNVLFALGRSATAIDRSRATSLLDCLGLAGLGNRRPAELSGGQRRRVALARTLLAPNQILLIDEPFANLDAAAADLVIQALRMRKGEGAAILVAVHSRSEAARITSEVVDLGRDCA